MTEAGDDHVPQLSGPDSGQKLLSFSTFPEAFGRGEAAQKKKAKNETENDEEDRGKSAGKDKGKDEDEDEADEDSDGGKKKSGGKEKDKESKKADEKEKKKKPFWKRPVLLGVMILVALLLIVGGIIWWLLTRNYESTDDAFIDGNIVQVAPRVAGRVLSLNVDDNEYVHADTVVIDIDPAPFRANYDNAVAAVQVARAKVQEAQADVAVQEAQVSQAQADMEAAQANEENARSDYLRYQALAPPARAQQQVDASTANYKSMSAQLRAAQQRVASAVAQMESSRTAVNAAAAEVAAAQAQLEPSALDLKYARVTAGQDGFVTRRTVEQGNYVQVGQEILDIVPKDVWVTANFKETQLRYLRPNQPVTITVDAYPDRKYRAHVQSLQTGTGAVFTTLPPENATGNYVKIVQRVPVKIVFDEPLDRVLAPGESVEPSVDISSGRQ